jgi:hypothetical protein
MIGKKQQLSREALGTRSFTYTAGVSLDEEGVYELIVAAASREEKYRMPEPQQERRPFTSGDLDDLQAQSLVFLREWEKARPASVNQVKCCSKVVENAFARARAKLSAPPNAHLLRHQQHGR